MADKDPTELKANLWSMDTVKIRSVGRWLNNNVRKTFDPSLLASGKHEWVLRTILNEYQMDDIENAYNYVMASTPKDAPDVTDKSLTNPKSDTPPGDINWTTVGVVDEASEVERATRQPKVFEEALSKPRGTFKIHGDALSDNKDLEAVAKGLVDKFAKTYATKNELASLDSRLATRISNVTDNLTKQIGELQDLVLKSNATSLTILFPNALEVEIGTVHKDTNLLIQYLAAGMHVFMTGPAGSGKSTGAEKAAQALGLTFGSISCCSQDTLTRFLGYQDAEGHYHTTEFRKAYQNGGLFLIDEIDAGNPNILAVLNAALANSRCSFPNGMVERHEKFRCVAAGNTWGTGRTLQYVGRNALDAATLNRFVMLHWDYDEALETVIAGLPAWSQYVQKCRAEVQKRGINYLITPRASINGAKLLRAGVKLEFVMRDVLFPNLDPDIIKQMPKTPIIEL